MIKIGPVEIDPLKFFKEIYYLFFQKRKIEFYNPLEIRLTRLESLIRRRKPWRARIECGYIENGTGSDHLDAETIKEWRKLLDEIADLINKKFYLIKKKHKRTCKEFLDFYESERKMREVYGFGSQIEKLVPHQIQLNKKIIKMKTLIR